MLASAAAAASSAGPAAAAASSASAADSKLFALGRTRFNSDNDALASLSASLTGGFPELTGGFPQTAVELEAALGGPLATLYKPLIGPEKYYTFDFDTCAVPAVPQTFRRELLLAFEGYGKKQSCIMLGDLAGDKLFRVFKSEDAMNEENTRLENNYYSVADNLNGKSWKLATPFWPFSSVNSKVVTYCIEFEDGSKPSPRNARLVADLPPGKETTVHLLAKHTSEITGDSLYDAAHSLLELFKSIEKLKNLSEKISRELSDIDEDDDKAVAVLTKSYTMRGGQVTLPVNVAEHVEKFVFFRPQVFFNVLRAAGMDFWDIAASVVSDTSGAVAATAASVASAIGKDPENAELLRSFANSDTSGAVAATATTGKRKRAALAPPAPVAPVAVEPPPPAPVEPPPPAPVAIEPDEPVTPTTSRARAMRYQKLDTLAFKAAFFEEGEFEDLTEPVVRDREAVVLDAKTRKFPGVGKRRAYRVQFRAGGATEATIWLAANDVDDDENVTKVD